MTDKTVRS